MLKARESEVDTIVAVCGSDIVPPCGRCRELIRQINAANMGTRVIIGPGRVVTVSELLPFGLAVDGRSDHEPPRSTRSVNPRRFVTECVFVDVRTQDAAFIDKVAELSYDVFRGHAPNWLPTMEAARQEVTESLEPGRQSLALLDTSQEPVGWVGVIPHSGGRVWEIHPIAVRTADQSKGYGRRLVEHVEWLAQSRGVLTLFAGTSDETGATSLYGINLYENPLLALATISCRKSHAYEFWLRVGFRIVGVMPDEEGVGKPGIHLAKAVNRKAASAEPETQVEA
jgi:aminoglycoside 6'-N-acetyltransferase I